MMNAMPDMHGGMFYCDFMGELSRRRNSQLYLEIGVNEGRLMSYIHTKKAVGVDPVYLLSANAAQHKQQTHLIAVPSDTFFASPDLVAALDGQAPDLSFLDGLHTFEFLLRDFYKTEALCTKRSLIVLHDCLPLDDIMTIRRLSEWQVRTVGTRWQGSWTGDVWKVIPILQRYRPDLRIVYVDCPPSGLVCITNLDPGSRVLEERYFEIVDEFAGLPNDEAHIAKLYETVAIVPSHDVLEEFDHSLFFSA